LLPHASAGASGRGLFSAIRSYAAREREKKGSLLIERGP
jgi:hypothetical protein